MKRLETKTSHGIFAITLNRPEKRNAIDMLMVDELSESLEHADLSADVRAVAIRGNGKDFCAGADLRELLESVDLPSEDNTNNAMRLGNIFLKIRELAKPVVAVVHGRALAGGCGLATACDIVLAHSDAQFGYP
ncbi:MAG: enoyl-CoA hydratase/isomerase family protein, partial [Gemmatimonadetes bacterium]|nr:enoyl-CoA hydratase/isomerase family protein [Gemmatimonadota bacterium]